MARSPDDAARFRLKDMRLMGVDFGRRRIGLALSDPSATLARPWKTIAGSGNPLEDAGVVARLLASGHSGADEVLEDVRAVVVGLPQRLGGGDTDQTQPVRRFADELGRIAGLQVYLQDERLSSHEAEERLKLRERDWRKRKARLDAAAAAIILQDFLDARPRW
jgi:putative Holliday junction resolvase